MLRNIDPLLGPQILHTLASMGHGDEIAIVDANYPGSYSGVDCIRADGISATHMLRAVLTLLPLDNFVPDPAITMQVVGDPDAVPEAVADFQAVINETADNPAKITALERFAFYQRAETVFAIIQTGERRLYGNIILKKGVVE